MSIEKLDTTAALVAIDLQKVVAGFPLAHPFGDIVSRTAQLGRAFRARRLPVVLVNVNGFAPGRTAAGFPKYSFPPDWTELVPELEQQPGDILVTKQRWGAFLGAGLDETLRTRGVTQIVLTGVATSAGVESTARSAYDLGYNVLLVTDAMSDRSLEMHRHCIENVFPRLGELATTSEVLKLLSE